MCHTAFDFYAYTVIGARGEAEAIELVSHLVPAGNLRLRAKLVTVDLDYYLGQQPTET